MDIRHLTCVTLLVLMQGSCGYPASRETLPPTQTTAAIHYLQHGDADSLRSVASFLHPGMCRDDIVRLLGPPAYSPTDYQDYYPTELLNEIGFTLTLVVNYHAAGTTQAGTVEWFFIDYIGE